jgi:hypothetical protein
MTLDPKDVIYGFGLVATLLLGLANLIYTRRATKKADFVRTVTNERVKWIESLRQNVSGYSGKAHNWAYVGTADPKEADKLLAELDVLAYLIRLQLNPTEEPDKQIEIRLKQVPSLATKPTLDEFFSALEEIVSLTQRLLKKEWNKVKDESEQGRLKR